MDNKVAVVTGAAKGIGKSIVEKFAQNNIDIVILDLDEQGQKVADELSEFVKTLFIQVDVSDYSALKSAKKKIKEYFGPVDYVVVNAGISYLHTVPEISVEEYCRVISVNLNSTFFLSKIFYNDLIENCGKLVIISSGSGITGTGGGAHYAASKAGQVGMMRTLSKELGPYGVNVNCVSPRVIESDLLDQLYSNKQSREELLNSIPIRRCGKVEDISNVVYFLTQPESSYIHGQNIIADGGRTF